MSFGEGNLHEKCEMYRKQLGGTNAAFARCRQRCMELESLVRSLAGMIEDGRARDNAEECRPRECRRCGAEFAPRYARQRTCDACLGRVVELGSVEGGE